MEFDLFVSLVLHHFLGRAAAAGHGVLSEAAECGVLHRNCSGQPGSVRGGGVHGLVWGH